MKTFNLNQLIMFSPEKPIKKHFINAKGFHAALICLGRGVEIPPHAEGYGVLFTVLDGIGTFSDGNDLKTLGANERLYFKKDEIRGIKAMEDLVVLGIQDRPKEEST